jgi:hypothetical protein
MPELTEKEFAKHLNTNFDTSVDGRPISLQLVEVKGYLPKENEQKGMERFSLFFNGPPDIRLPQNIYELRHAQMGEFEIFLVPVSGDEKSFRYEAVFNYYKT